MSGERPARILGRELLVFAFATAATLVATWPLGLHLLDFERLSDRSLDDHVYWWDFWWLHEALLVRGIDPLFCPDVFWPRGASVAISPFALPFGLVALPFQAAMGVLPGAVAAVKVLGFATFPLALHGTSLLLRRLGVPLVASLLAGALFAFTPFRMLQLGRIHYLAGAFVPWFLHAALIAMQGGRVRWHAAAAFFFALAGATDASLLLELLLASGALWIVELIRRDRSAGAAKVTLRLLGCGLAGTLLLSPLLARFLHDARDASGADVAARLDYDYEPAGVQRILSPDLGGLAWYLAPALHETLLMDPHERTLLMHEKSSARLAADLLDSFRPPPQDGTAGAIVAGFIVLVAGAALVLSLRERAARVFLVLAAIGFVLALGPKRGAGDVVITMPYGWLAELVPGMAAGRYPVAHLRLFHLGVGLAAGLAFLRPRPSLLVAGGIALLAFLAVSPLRPFRLEPVGIEEVHERIAADPTPGAVLELPPRREIVLRRMALGQIVHERPLMSGPLTRVPDAAWRFFTDEPVVRRLMRPPLGVASGRVDEIEENRAALLRHGVRFLVVRRSLASADPTAWEELLRYLAAHDFALQRTREGHVLALVE